ncbi:hypothetical protein CBR_g59535 [Chara braunii]|uniref:Uncharacterized protein n=1 Tax=Chara braunii TaxID=69332 RepID=A0A388MEY9_CHABU|nr:hypothetical protein CBR_g59535 [Chara braunii]|eukprot:GBG93138.1 hypothetical protein CBR_g59535 [Chara braunii]
MKAWVTSTLSESLKLINAKLDGVDKKLKLDAAERDELERLRREVRGQGNKELSSNEKRKRSVARTPVENSPSATRAKPRSRGSSKLKPKRIELSDDEGPSGAKQNLQPKMESTSSELSEIKRLLAALISGLPDPKGKAKVVEPGTGEEGRKGKAIELEHPGPAIEANPKEDVDIVQNAQVDGDEEDPDEDGFAAYMKIRAEYYNSLHYTRVQDLCKERDVEYFKKDVAVWELARQDLQEYADSLKGDLGTGERGGSRRKEAPGDKNYVDSEGDCDAVKGN